MNAGIIGLVVITLERYFKVVHAVAHRKYYKKWMTKVGVAVPWIAGFCTFAIPAYSRTAPVPGRCPRTNAYSNKTVCILSIGYLVEAVGLHYRYVHCWQIRIGARRHEYTHSSVRFHIIKNAFVNTPCSKKRSHQTFGSNFVKS